MAAILFFIRHISYFDFSSIIYWFLLALTTKVTCPHKPLTFVPSPVLCFTETDEPHTLVVLAEEELVLIDLETQGCPSFSLPYFNSLHSSPITCSQHVSNIPDNLWQKIVDAGQAQNKNVSARVRKSKQYTGVA